MWFAIRPGTGLGKQRAITIGTACALALLIVGSVARAQSTAENEPQTTEDVLRVMAQQAAVIFAGQITAIRRLDGANGATGVAEIDFAVDDAVRGVRSNTYTLREWWGLWTSGQPLPVGQRYLMFLHAAGSAGLSSPVGGMDGAIPIRGSLASEAGPAEPLRPASRVAGVAEAALPADRPANTWTVDLRWVATRVARPVSYAGSSAAHPTALPQGSLAHIVSVTPVHGTDPDAPVEMPAAVTQSTGYASVMALLHGWETAGNGAR